MASMSDRIKQFDDVANLKANLNTSFCSSSPLTAVVLGPKMAPLKVPSQLKVSQTFLFIRQNLSNWQYFNIFGD